MKDHADITQDINVYGLKNVDLILTFLLTLFGDFKREKKISHSLALCQICT